jgi:hypothetical protein
MEKQSIEVSDIKSRDDIVLALAHNGYTLKVNNINVKDFNSAVKRLNWEIVFWKE